MNILSLVITYKNKKINSRNAVDNYIINNLSEQGLNVQSIELKNEFLVNILKFKTLYYRYLLKRDHFRFRDPILLKSFAKKYNKILKTIDFDMLFGFGTIAFSFIETTKPYSFWTDATFKNLLNFYHDYQNYSSKTINEEIKRETEIFNKAKYCIFSTKWAADSAINEYNLNPNKVHIVPFGANIECNRNQKDIEIILENRKNNKINLLFCGIDFVRKGGLLTIAIANNLVKKGFSVQLDIIGCMPPKNLIIPQYVTFHGFIDKKTIDGKELIDNLFKNAHFLVLPTRADTFGHVFCEANSFAVPCLTTNSGGVAEVVINNKNGFIFDIENEASEYADRIAECFSDYDSYIKLAFSSFKEYNQRLNWRVSAERVANIFRNSP